MRYPIIFILLTILLLQNCSVNPRYHNGAESSKEKYRNNSSDKALPSLSKSGKNSVVLTASYYADKFHGQKTSNGEVFNMYGFSAAHKTLPFGTILKVTYIKTGKSVMVKVNDRGPFVEGRSLDLSYMAAKKIDLARDGVGKVKVKVVKQPENRSKN